ncbi:hypothetical protein [Desulfovibrio subterraneus]|uniref:Uncharacterized protein n=1 Tax=Desulfovibrio subterraneus TaxID=2718620 RepID=A0A7J0BJP9_9BACT|nr:hypothetical protein [Desulfovibrio subterraneus]GFM33304.1 hypothetical protein DSM101010T_16690 [Desulfovibrio subterraneus]
MDEMKLDELLARSASSDVASLLKAKEEAKRLMRDDPSPQAIAAFERASRLLEARMPSNKNGEITFSSTAQVIEHLTSQQRKIAKSKLYADIKSGRLRKRENGFVQSDVDAYARTLPFITTPDKQANSAEDLARRKQEAEIKRIEEQAKREQIKRLREEGKLIPREDVEMELSTRGVALETGLKSAIEVQVLELINVVEGNPNHSHTLINMLESIIDTALHEYSREMEIEVEFINDAEEPDIPNAEDGAEA